MATYFLRSKHISRGKGSLATRAAAYRAGERIKDERTGQIFDYSDRQDVAYKEVVVPSDLAGRDDMAWTQDRAILWNTVEHAGMRRNSRTAREWLVFVPVELTPEQRTGLVRGFAAELAERYRCAVDLAIHEPRPGADSRNHHAHLLMTTREVSPDGVGARTSLELVGRERHERGLGDSREEYRGLRKRWADVTNEAFRRAGLELRIDHRSLAHQGINREPTASIPEKVFYSERKHGPSEAGDAIRARHRERVEARKIGPEELARVVERQSKELKALAREELARRDNQPKGTRWSALTLEQRNELRREKYEARRVIERQDPVYEARRRERARQREHEYRAKNPEKVRERTRQWRLENSEEINRKQRDYRSKNSTKLNAKRRSRRREHAAELNRKQRDYRRAVSLERSASESNLPKTAMDSARDWLEYRRSHGAGGSAEEAARDWVKYRESQPQSDVSKSEAVQKEGPGEEARPPPDHGLEL